MTVNDHASQERYVALYAWLCGQMSPRTPHAADLFAQDRECLYDAFLSVLVGTGLGFSDYDDNRVHHGLYAFDFFVGDIEAPPIGRGVDGQRVPGMAGDPAADGAARAMCHAIVDTWLGDTSAHIPFVASVIASVATLELVADVRVDECVFECDLPREYARFTANKPWEDGSLPIGSLDACLLAVESSSAFAFGAAATLRAPHGGPEMLGWAADAVARALSACGHTGGVQIRVRFVHTSV